MSELHVVLHPRKPPGVEAFLRSLQGIRLECPDDDDGVAQAMARGAQVLATYIWREDFFSPSLRWIAGMGAGYEQYPLQRFAEAGVVLTNAAGVHADCVAEHTFALLLALTRRIGESVRNMTQACWIELPGEELSGKKMAIVGMGHIGEAVARRAQNWGMTVAGVKRDPANYQGCVADVRGTDSIPELCEWADIVVLCAPATPDKSPLIRAPELERLGAGWIINVGRGSLIDEPALIQALTEGRLRGAGLDVTAVEPLPTASPLWQMPKVVLSAHNAGDSPGFGPRWGEILSHNLFAFTGKREWRNRIAVTGVST